jgi:hypothetical protein
MSLRPTGRPYHLALRLEIPIPTTSTTTPLVDTSTGTDTRYSLAPVLDKQISPSNPTYKQFLENWVCGMSYIWHVLIANTSVAEDSFIVRTK